MVSPGMGRGGRPLALKRDVSAPSRPPVEPLNAERGKWARKEGGVASDVRVSTPLGACPPLKSRGSGHPAGFHLGPGASPMNGVVVLLIWFRI